MEGFYKSYYILSKEELDFLLDDEDDNYQYTFIVGYDKEEAAQFIKKLDEIEEILIDQSKMHYTQQEALDEIRQVLEHKKEG